MRKLDAECWLGREAYRGFEGLIAELLAKFLNMPEGRLDAEITDAIRRIAEFLGLAAGSTNTAAVILRVLLQAAPALPLRLLPPLLLIRHT